MKTQRRSVNASPSFWSTLDEGPCRSAKRTILVASAMDEASAVALRRADALTRLIDADVVVLHVMPEPSWFRSLFSTQARSGDLAEQVLVASTELRRWCKTILGYTPGVVVQCGEVAELIVEVAQSCHATLVVLGDTPPANGWLSRSAGIVQRVIRDTTTPVLVARPEREGHQIVAATDFTDARYPALCQAVRLGTRLGSRVTFVHNVTWSEHLGEASLFGLPIMTPVRALTPDVDRRRIELEEVAHFMGHDIETVVDTKPEAADAILAVARARDADLVVIGMRTPERDGTAVEVARSARRSVLAVPIRDGVMSGWAA